MTLDEYKNQYPFGTVSVQIDDVERLMTQEEYDAWCIESVNYINNYVGP